jgi:hypothetical protein
MARSLTAGAVAETTKATVALALFAELVYDSGTVRVWTGVGNHTWDGETWQGLGSFGGLSDCEETSHLSPRSTNLVLSGVPSATIALALTENYQGRTAKVWLAFLTVSTGAVIVDPILIFSGRMGVMGIETGQETGKITISVESHLVNLGRASNRRFTRESQRRYFPNDAGLDYVPTIQQQNIKWGIP